MLDHVNHSDAADSSRQFKALEAKLQPARIRSTLAFAGLYQLTHEQLKRAVLDQVKGFFGHLVLDDARSGGSPTAKPDTSGTSSAEPRTRSSPPSRGW